MKGNYNAFKARRCQWDAYIALSGLENLRKYHSKASGSDTFTDYAAWTPKKFDNLILSALYSVMTSETLQIISSMDGLRKGNELNAEAILHAIECFVAASDCYG